MVQEESGSGSSQQQPDRDREIEIDASMAAKESSRLDEQSLLEALEIENEQ